MATESFVYVARLEMGHEVNVRRILEAAPVEALAEHGVLQFSSYVGSGFCVLHFELPDGDFQVQFERLVNDPRVNQFHRELAPHLIEGQQIAQTYSAGDDRRGGGARAADGPTVTSAQLPLASLVARWTAG